LQTKGLREVFLDLRILKGLGEARSVESGWTEKESHTPPVFLPKSAQAIENKGRGCEKKLQERCRVRNGLKIKEI